VVRRAPHRKPATELRKAPRQERAGATFEAILEAAARILSSDGPRGLTTNRVARRAGVSVGSLYQYFPNKHAIVRALLERQLARAAALRPPDLDDASLPLEARVRAAVEWHFAAYGEDPGLARSLRALAEALPEGQRGEVAALRADRTRRTIASGLAPGRDAEIVAFAVEVCLDALLDAATRRRPEWLTSPRFRAEVAELLARYTS
jgi:AcrR family transcriptional regulator